ncbi:hypothetical protein JB92DRAFT_2837956 [Gautieria morchelliformis]|nr:hypothetical protein JB92DRAFT_2837956 [Gautieria morchelliformis]
MLLIHCRLGLVRLLLWLLAGLLVGLLGLAGVGLALSRLLASGRSAKWNVLFVALFAAYLRWWGGDIQTQVLNKKRDCATVFEKRVITGLSECGGGGRKGTKGGKALAAPLSWTLPRTPQSWSNCPGDHFFRKWHRSLYLPLHLNSNPLSRGNSVAIAPPWRRAKFLAALVSGAVV